MAIFVAIPDVACAELSFAIDYVDEVDDGFNDPTLYVGAGSSGQTLGEQRRAALQMALDAWAKSALFSNVPVAVHASFEDWGCDAGVPSALTAVTWVLGSRVPQLPGVAPDRAYPMALLDRLAGIDLDPTYPDVIITFNTADCSEPWSYDLNAAIADDFVTIAMHEIGHGLGFLSRLDWNDGSWIGGLPDPYSANLFSLMHDAHLHELNPSERVIAATTPRNLVWAGPAVRAAVKDFLEPGAPSLWTDPVLPGFSGRVADGNLGVRPLDVDITGDIFSVYGCTPPMQVAGRFVLLRASCPVAPFFADVAALGGVGVLTMSMDPPLPADLANAVPLGIPLLRLPRADADLLDSAMVTASVAVHVRFDSTQPVGTDEQGRPFILTTDPSLGHAIVVHWDPLVRPDLLMEGGGIPLRTLDLTVAALVDVGWSICGDAIVTLPELCDEGANNADVPGAACRTDCTLPRCGDAVLDPPEACDTGSANSDVTADACRSDCSTPSCGDSVVDTGEACDGDADTSSQAGPCRSDCTRCGDGVLDEAEDCDMGPENADLPGAGCRSDCTRPTCGDAVRDNGEACDWGNDNSDTEPDACRSDCSVPRCGDGVVDNDEDCDPGDGANAHRECVDCRWVTREETPSDAGSGDSGVAAESSDAGGCGCKVGGSAARAQGGAPWAVMCLLVAGVAARRFRNRNRTRAAG